MRLLLSALAWMILGLTACVPPASAQEPGRVYRIGWLSAGEQGLVPAPFEKWTGTEGAFRDVLRDSGFIVGKNLVVDVRDAQGDVSRLPDIAEALVATKPDVLLTAGASPTVAAMRATKTIPIVFPGVGFPVERGIVKSLVNHASNVTGQASNMGNQKMWQLLRDAAPSLRRAGFVSYAPNTLARDSSPEYRAKVLEIWRPGSAQAGFELIDLMVDRLEELEPKVAALANEGKAGLFLSTDMMLYSWRAEIMSMATRYRLPTACSPWFGWGKAGCLITYGEDFSNVYQSAAAQVVKIFHGTKPADIPIEQPTKFKLIVNLKTARALGLTLPPAMVTLADEVIE